MLVAGDVAGRPVRRVVSERGGEGRWLLLTWLDDATKGEMVVGRDAVVADVVVGGKG